MIEEEREKSESACDPVQVAALKKKNCLNWSLIFVKMQFLK